MNEKSYPKVSIIIPLAKWNDYIEESIRRGLALDYPNYEIIILPDDSVSKGNIDGKVKIFPTGKVGPAEKRNIGVRKSEGSIIAFIDDDTYPVKDWLKNAVKNFSDPDTAAVGGPAVTPDSDSLMQKASGAVYSSLLGGGGYRYRYVTGKRQFVDDFPSCNFIMRKEVFLEIGGFQTNFWPGEDTALCLDIIDKLKKKIIYDPEVLLYHHRRTLFKQHLKQIKAYAIHRGYFAKRYPKTSLRLSYFIPSIFVLFVSFGWIVNIRLYFAGILMYFVLAIISVIPFKGIYLKILTLLGIVSTHIVYGIWFIRGLLSNKLGEEKPN